MGECLGSGARVPGFRSRPCHLLSVTLGKFPDHLACHCPHLCNDDNNCTFLKDG